MTHDTQAARLQVSHLDVGYSKRQILQDVTLSIPDGKITALIGANGCGKSTLLRTIGRVIAPLSGQILLDGKDIHHSPRKAVAKTLAMLPQTPVAPDGLTVRQLCHFGRYPHRKLFSQSSAQDEAIVEKALHDAGLMELAERPIQNLSGGQRQRAWIAMALAQDTPLLLLDEPTTYLDIAHQIEILQLLRELNQQKGTTIVMVVHDLNHAAQFADNIIAVSKGKIYQQGAPHELLTPELIKEVFGISAMVVPHPEDNSPLCLPLFKAI